MFFWKILFARSVDIITNNGLSEKDEMASGGQAFSIQYSGSCSLYIFKEEVDFLL